jgi:hypothetical protein
LDDLLTVVHAIQGVCAAGQGPSFQPHPSASGGRFVPAACKNPVRCTWHHKAPNSAVARPPCGRALPSVPLLFPAEG